MSYKVGWVDRIVERWCDRSSWEVVPSSDKAMVFDLEIARWRCWSSGRSAVSPRHCRPVDLAPYGVLPEHHRVLRQRASLVAEDVIVRKIPRSCEGRRIGHVIVHIPIEVDKGRLVRLDELDRSVKRDRDNILECDENATRLLRDRLSSD